MSVLFFLLSFSTFARSAGFDLVPLAEVDPTIIQEMRYATSHNFVGHPIEGYRASKCLLTRAAAVALHQVQLELLQSSQSLKVYDCYRPQRAVNEFVRWAKDINDLKMKKEFYPKVDKSRLFLDGYIAEKSGHSRGSTLDLTIVTLPMSIQEKFKEGDPLRECFLGADLRFKDSSLDMGTGFDCFDPLAHTANPKVTGTPKENRLHLKSLMERFGFTNLPEEWWHYTLKNEPHPNDYFDEKIQ